jgi:hypothetical protein
MGSGAMPNRRRARSISVSGPGASEEAAGGGKKRKRALSGGDLEQEALVEAAKPLLAFLCLVDALHDKFKPEGCVPMPAYAVKGSWADDDDDWLGPGRAVGESPWNRDLSLALYGDDIANMKKCEELCTYWEQRLVHEDTGPDLYLSQLGHAEGEEGEAPCAMVVRLVRLGQSLGT